MASINVLRGLRPFEAALFVKLELPARLVEQHQRANDRQGKKHGLPIASVTRAILRAICVEKDFSYVSLSSRGSAQKTLCFAFRADDQIFAACGSAFGTKVTPGQVWRSLQPFGQGNDETLKRKFLAWAEAESAVELTPYITVTASDDELQFLQQIQTEDNRDHALLVFADWLEDRGDARAERIRTFAKRQ